MDPKAHASGSFGTRGSAPGERSRCDGKDINDGAKGGGGWGPSALFVRPACSRKKLDAEENIKGTNEVRHHVRWQTPERWRLDGFMSAGRLWCRSRY